MKQTKMSKPSKLVALLLGATMLGAVSQSALALGTASGLTVSNTATLSYSVGAAIQTPVASSDGVGPAGTPTTFTVDNKANITVSGSNAAVELIGPGVSGVLGQFTVTNNGNTIQDVLLTAADVAGGTLVAGPFSPAATDAFASTVAVVAYVESGATPGYQPAEDTATFIDELAIDGVKTVYVVGTTPVTQANGTQDIVSLTGQVAAGGAVGAGAALVNTALATAGVDVVLADAIGTDDTNPAAPIGDGLHSARDAAEISSAVISVTKTALVLCDPMNGIANPKNIPTSIVQWTIVVSNTGTASATLGSIADGLDLQTTFEAGTGAGLTAPIDAATCVAGAGLSGVQITSSNGARALGGTAGVMTNAADADGATASANSVAIDFAAALPAVAGPGGYSVGELKPAETATVKFNVTIN